MSKGPSKRNKPMTSTAEEEPELRKRLEGQVRLLSIEQHKEMVQKLLGNMPISFIRDFAVIDSSNHPRLGKVEQKRVGAQAR